MAWDWWQRQHGPLRLVRAGLGAPQVLVTALRRNPPAEPIGLGALVLLSLGFTVAGASWSMTWFPPVMLTVPLLFAGLVLSVRALRRLAVAVALCLTYSVLDQGLSDLRIGGVFVVVLTGLVSYEVVRSREETGLAGSSGESVLLELRARLEQQGALPALGSPWCAESVVKPAGGGPFSGDFVVSCLHERLDIALVDVSGKGLEAGTRSLLLSGAMGGLLGGRGGMGFLADANSYLMRQDWDEGFATAVHLSLDLTNGQFALASAGHPPVAHFDAGSGRWGLLDERGPALGLLPDVTYTAMSGVLRPGDALLLYTDGLVEVPGRDLDRGIDKLLGEAERLVTQGFEGGGERLIERVSLGTGDDRGLVLLWRTVQ